MLYGVGAVMGFTPQQVNEMTLWEFEACASGYAEAHGGKSGKGAVDPDAIDDERLAAMGIEGF